MSHPSMAGSGVRPGGDGNTTVSEDEDIEKLLGTLEDADCRSIIRETSEQALSASELSESCGLPLSTAYRKLDQLTDVGVLEERIRISQSGQHTSEYILQMDSIKVTVDSESGLELELSREPVHQSGNSMMAGAD